MISLALMSLSLNAFLSLEIPCHASIFSKSSIVEIKGKISTEKEKILEAEIKKRGILGLLYDINKDLSKTNAEILSLEEQMRSFKKKIENQSVIVARMEKSKDKQKLKLSVRLRALYKMGAQGYAQVLLSSNSSTELSRNVKFMRIVTQKDLQLLVGYRQSIAETLREQDKLKAQVKIYLIADHNLQSEKKVFADQKENQVYLLSSIEKDRELHLMALKEWREAGIHLEEKLRNIGKLEPSFDEVDQASFFERQGQMKAPVSRVIVQKYGIFTDNRFDTKIFHKGLFFAAKLGDEISALYLGKVVYVGWVNGFGDTVILDHGDHYYSVYAHCSALLKKIGDEVQPGEVIAKSGETGSLRGPGLYLEIRHFSESLDPLPWLDLKSIARL